MAAMLSYKADNTKLNGASAVTTSQVCMTDMLVLLMTEKWMAW